MASQSPTPGTERARLATAGARAVTLDSLSNQPKSDVWKGNIFLALLLLAVTLALAGLAAIIIQAAVEGAPAFSTKLVLCIELLGHFSFWTGERDAEIRRIHGCKHVQLRICLVQVTPEEFFW